MSKSASVLRKLLCYRDYLEPSQGWMQEVFAEDLSQSLPPGMCLGKHRAGLSPRPQGQARAQAGRLCPSSKPRPGTSHGGAPYEGDPSSKPSSRGRPTEALSMRGAQAPSPVPGRPTEALPMREAQAPSPVSGRPMEAHPMRGAQAPSPVSGRPMEAHPLREAQAPSPVPERPMHKQPMMGGMQ
jgi:hypothetical protein